MTPSNQDQDNANKSLLERHDPKGFAMYQRIKAQDEAMLVSMMKQYTTSTQIFIYRHMKQFGNMGDAEELAADVFIDVWDKINQFNPNKCRSFRAWFLGIAKNKAQNFRQKISHRYNLLNTRQEEVALWGQEYAQDDQHRQILEEFMECIPESEQALWKLYFDGRTHKEIAVELGMPIGTVKTKIHRMFQQFQRKKRAWSG